LQLSKISHVQLLILRTFNSHHDTTLQVQSGLNPGVTPKQVILSAFVPVLTFVPSLILTLIPSSILLSDFMLLGAPQDRSLAPLRGPSFYANGSMLLPCHQPCQVLLLRHAHLRFTSLG
jgi:hypothetical protein